MPVCVPPSHIYEPESDIFMVHQPSETAGLYELMGVCRGSYPDVFRFTAWVGLAPWEEDYKSVVDEVILCALASKRHRDDFRNGRLARETTRRRKNKRGDQVVRRFEVIEGGKS